LNLKAAIGRLFLFRVIRSGMHDIITVTTLAELFGSSTRAVSDLARWGIVARSGSWLCARGERGGLLRKLATGG
jgi:hypothetical protein